MKTYLFVDTETTGLPLTWDAPYTDTYNWPRIIQFSFELCWDNGRTIKKVTSLVKPDHWSVPDKAYWLSKGKTEEEAEEKGKFWIEHGYTQKENYEKGRPMQDLLESFLLCYKDCDEIIAHNLGYDFPIIQCEMHRYGITLQQIKEKYPYNLRPEGFKPKKVCTKLLSEPICKLPGFKGKYKWPTLSEAHIFMFGEDFEGGHDAGADVAACKRVYQWIRNYEDALDIL